MNVTLAPYLEKIVVEELRKLRITDWIGDREVNINWSTRVDDDTGAVTVTPSFPSNLTQTEREQLVKKGFTSKTLYTFGHLVRLIPTGLHHMILTLKQLGISAELLSYYVREEDAPALRKQLASLFQ